MNEEAQIKLKHVIKQYRLYNSDTTRLVHTLFPFGKSRYKSFTALNDINLEVGKGEIVGVIGRNGSGKSTLLRVIAGVTAPTSGNVKVCGTIVPLFGLGAGFHAELTGRENLHYFTIMQNFDNYQSEDIIQQAIDFADIGHFVDQPMRTYSSGMRARLAFSISIFLDADIMILDEALAVGDAHFKEKSYEKMHALINSGKTIIMATHSEKEAEKVCKRVILLQNGEIMQDGLPEEVIKFYRASIKRNAPANKKPINNQRKKKIETPEED